MKKLIYLIVLALILGLVLTGCFLSNVGQVPTTEQSGISYLTKGTPGDHDVFTLYAGQHIDVGTVEVWNDTENLYVKYMVDDPWCLIETHLHVAASLEDIPQTEKGNPIPGQFGYKSEHNCESDFLYTIPLANLVVELYIAAHAEVVRHYYETVWQIGDVEEINIGTGWLENYADEFNWAAPADPTTMGPSLAVDVPSFTNPFIVGTTPTSEFPYNSNYNRGYATNFDVQWNGSMELGGLLTISWSPGQSASEKKVVSEDGNTLATFTAQGLPEPGEGWFMNIYPLVEHSVIVGPLTEGVHTINFQHTQGDGTFWDWVKLEKSCVQEETAWAAIFDEPGKIGFPGRNWATYFNYTLEPIFIETVTVFPDGGDDCSTTILETGKKYRLDVSGTYIFANWTGAGIADAKYSLRPAGICNDTGSTDWISGDDLFNCYGVRYLELLLDGLPQPWGAFNETHTYSIEHIGTGNTVCFKILDTAYGDNSGSLSVDITWIP